MKRFLQEKIFNHHQEQSEGFLYLIALLFLCGIALYFFSGHYTNIMLDFGREVYYPQRILEGKVLYKDLFVIYGPLAYQLNAILYKIFGAKLSTLYFAGSCCSLFLVSGIFLIARKFLSAFLSFTIGFLTIVVGVSSPILFNFTFPYSWAMLYGIIAFLYSVLFLIKYNQENKPVFLYTSSFLAGVCISCKYEFAVYAFLFLIYLIFATVKDFKTGLKAICTFFVVPILSFGILFLQGLNINDLISSFKNVKSMTQTQTLTYFYQSVGAYFHPKVLLILISAFIKTFISLGILFLGVSLKDKNKILSGLIIFIGLIVSFWLMTGTNITTIAFLPLLLIFLSMFCCKKILSNKPLIILVSSAIIVSLKSIWGLLILSYASYYFFFIIIAVLALLFNFIDKKYENITGVYLLLFTFCIWFINSNVSGSLQNKIETSKGKIYTYKESSVASNNLINYIQKETQKDDRIVIFPEGLIINFLTDRKSDDYYNSMLPLYIESFGEDKIIEHFAHNKPEYFVLSNEKMSDYGFKHICNDYGLALCSFIFDNYNQAKIIDTGYRYLVYKRK